MPGYYRLPLPLTVRTVHLFGASSGVPASSFADPVHPSGAFVRSFGSALGVSVRLPGVRPWAASEVCGRPFAVFVRPSEAFARSSAAAGLPARQIAPL